MPAPFVVADFSNRFEPDPITAQRAVEKPDTAIRGFEEETYRFGFRWFIPALARHRGIWRDVLLASLAIQLIGLATPLLTQVVIDKVVVHQTASTLLAVAVGLGDVPRLQCADELDAPVSGAHTGNRVDAVLATQVLRHLLRLPLPYFEHRPTGHHGGAAARRGDDPRVHHRRCDVVRARPAVSASSSSR